MNPLGSRKANAELERLLQGRPNFNFYFSKTQVTASLWDYGEDELAKQALVLSEEDLVDMQAIAACFEDPSYQLPLSGQRITHNHVIALAAITLYEGKPRPLARIRRRPEKDRPAPFRPEPPDPADYIA